MNRKKLFYFEYWVVKIYDKCLYVNLYFIIMINVFLCDL